MKRWTITKTTIAATLFAATAAQAQTVFFSDDFEDTTLDKWENNIILTGTVLSNIDDGGNRIGSIVHVSGGRTGLGNSNLSGFSETRFEALFKVKALTLPAGCDIDLILGRDGYSAGTQKTFVQQLDPVLTANVWSEFRVIVNNDASLVLNYDGGAESVATGSVDVWKDGVKITDDGALDGANVAGSPSKSFGFIVNKNEPSVTVLVDDVQILGFIEGPANFTSTPDTQLTLNLNHPDTVTTNSIITSFVPGSGGTDVQITEINLTNLTHAGAFSSLTFAPITMDAFPSNTPVEIVFDSNAASFTDGSSDKATGSVSIVWTELTTGLFSTNTIAVVGNYNNPDVELLVGPLAGLGLSILTPATAATNTATVWYNEGPAHTNVQITAIAVANASAVGFSTIHSLPLTLNDPGPSNATFEVVFDNATAGLTHKQTASADIVVTWHELGSTNQTSVLPVTATIINPPAGPLQLSFTGAVGLNAYNGGANDFALQKLNELGKYTNSWNFASGGNQDTAAGYIEINSALNNTRGIYNLIENGTVGMDNVGAVDVEPMTNGVYRYDFEYEVKNVGASGFWGIEAYALINQGASGTVDYVEYDHGHPGFVAITPAGQGIASYDLHSDGNLVGAGNVTRTNGSVTVNITNGYDAVFTMYGADNADVRLYDINMVRIGDYEVPVPPTSPTNAVLDAAFADGSTTNSMYNEFDYDTNDDPSNTWVYSASTTWEGGSLKLLSAANTSRSLVIITPAGTAGYDDVGANDTIALTSGTYTVSMDVNFSANDGAGSVTVFSFGGQDATGNVNDVRLDLGEGTNDAVIVEQKLVPIVRGTAFFTELARKDYSANTIETLTFTGLSVQEGEDLVIRWNGYANADFSLIDNVQVLRTGGAAPVGFDAWAASFSLTGDDALPGADVEPDGLDNLMEYALGGIPNVDDASTVAPNITLALDAGTNWFYHVYNERTDDPRLSYELVRKLDLVLGVSWTTGAIEYVGESAESGGFKSVTNRASTAANAAFLRLNVEKAD
ncbi:hypothetical protein [Pontiella sulfatireligans]|uniref:Uncharacterized protein n=1 Tax=Pontiella sulfatireligans TaxID=2750658 RepID=A0A6C2UJL4_9BACT|nr:hypothetical protein [Pontiella sulfatireligans]VGO19627.1 hypothetical protein SCARR_01686 [Pontiella sulfatireligans]